MDERLKGTGKTFSGEDRNNAHRQGGYSFVALILHKEQTVLSTENHVVTLQPFEAMKHTEMLKEWLNRTHVARWWGDPERQLAICLQQPEQGDHALICVGLRPVGYIRWQKPSQQELASAGISGLPEEAVDIDILIGEPKYTGHGIGPKALRLLLNELAQEPGVSVAGMGVSIKNQAAVRAYEKAGFSKFRQFNDPEYGPCWMMITDVRKDT